MKTGWYVTADKLDLIKGIHSIFGDSPFTHSDLQREGLSSNHWTGRKLQEAGLIEIAERTGHKRLYIWKLSAKGKQIVEEAKL